METEVLLEKELLPYPFGSPRDILTALFRQKIKILIVFMAIFLAVGWWVYSKETLYDAKATIILKFGREHIFRPEIGDVAQIVRFNESAAIEAERKILESKQLIRQVVEVIGVQNIYPKLMRGTDEVQKWQVKAATSKFLGNLESFADKGANVIEIVFSHQNPEVAAMALNVLIEELKERHLQVFSDPKAAFLVQRLGEYEKDLENAERTLQSFKEKHDLSSPLEDQQRRLLDQRSHLDMNNKTMTTQLQGLLGKIASLETQMKTVPALIPLSTTEAGGMVAKAKSELFTLKRQRQGLLIKYTEKSAPVRNIEKEIELMEAFIKTQKSGDRDTTVTRGKNPVFQNIEVARLSGLSELKTLQASSKVITGQIQKLDTNIQRLDTLREELVGFERAKANAEEYYKLYVKKVEEAKVSEEMDKLKMSNIKVIQAAEVPTNPAGRPKHIKLLLGTLFGAIMSVGLAFVFEYFQGGYTRPDQAAEDLGLPILASFGQKG